MVHFRCLVRAGSSGVFAGRIILGIAFFFGLVLKIFFEPFCRPPIEVRRASSRSINNSAIRSTNQNFGRLATLSRDRQLPSAVLDFAAHGKKEG